MVASYYLNVGHVKDFVRGQNFPLNDCDNRRILIWNELSIMPSAYDTVKMLTEGDPFPASVKHRNDATILKTAIIFTANNNKLCDSLKQIDGCPHPLSYYK
uniref:Parvovirus non-structural protein 1 helicase domain-containing protein n=1 Tax=Tetranychus urticae TaxID=32264 RepID=T1KBZ7_TETUR